MLSRVADSIYWMARYVERAENVARFIDVNLNLSLDLGPETGNQWDPLIYTTGDQEDFYSRYGDASQGNVLQFLAFDEENPNSIISCLKCARENARTVREVISTTMWEELNKFYLLVRGAVPAQVSAAPFDFFQQIRLAGYMLEGATEATMSHGEPWHFRRLGRLIERADKTSRILDVKYFLLLPNTVEVGSSVDTNQWAALLKSASALEAYRHVHGRITPTQVAQFLLLDRDFPRAVHFCLLRMEQSLLSITGGTSGMYHNLAEQRLGRLRSEFDYANISEIIEEGLHEFVDNIQSRLNDIGAAIFDTFFATQPV
ncbi:MAG TPA: alpha-E domain-containing protein [Pirellulaceae bacterium]|nr:alpha-E domain-containing protein [Pirellulaceae bacterium]